MVSFKDDRFVIEFRTVGEPFEDWVRLQDELYDLLCYITPELRGDSDFHLTYKLLSELLPSIEQARRMKE